MIIEAPAMRTLHALLERVAARSVNVLLLGETGVGKEVFAAQVHACSPRASGPFVKLNCAAFSESLIESELFGYEKGAFTGAASAKPGLIESAEGGTLFLDEVGELPLTLQAKLLRVLEDREVRRVGSTRTRCVDVRFVAATNRNLEAEIAAGRFRSDLYFRLNGFSLTIPPLRERRSEILPLAEYFLSVDAQGARRVKVPGLSLEARDALLAYSWPGNIRELRQAIEHAVVLCEDAVMPEHLPSGMATLTPPVHSTPPPEPADSLPQDSVTVALRDDLPTSVLIDGLKAWSLGDDGSATGYFPRDSENKGISTKRIAEMLARKLRSRDRPVIQALEALPESHLNKLAEHAAAFRKFIKKRVTQTSSIPSASPLPTRSPSNTQDPFESTRNRLGRIWALRNLANLYVRRALQTDFDKFRDDPRFKLFIITNVAGSGKTAFVTANGFERLNSGASVLMTTGAELCNSKTSSRDSALIERDLARLHPLLFGVDAASDSSHEAWKERWERVARACSSATSPLYIIVDAVNEFDGDIQTLKESIRGILERTQTCDVKFVITCRHEAWAGTDSPLNEAIADFDAWLYRAVNATRNLYYSGQLGANTEGLYSDDEFKSAWERYATHFSIKGHPHLGRRNALYHPFFLDLYCRERKETEAVFTVLRPFDVLKEYAYKRCYEVAECLYQTTHISKTDLAAIVNEVIGRLAWRTFEKDHPMWLGHKHALNLLTSDGFIRQALPPGIDAARTVSLILSELCSVNVIRLHGENLKFSFEIFREFWGGVYLAKQVERRSIDSQEGIKILEVLRSRGQIQVFETLRYATLDLELRSSRYRDLLKSAAGGHPDLQEMACRAIQDLMVVRGVAKALPSEFYRSHTRITDLLSDDAKRSQEVERICMDVFETIVTRKDFTVRFTLKAALESLVQACPQTMLGLLDSWVSLGGLKKTIALGVLPAFGPTPEVITRLIHALSDPGHPRFWQRRSAADAMVEMFHRLEVSSLQHTAAVNQCAEALKKTVDDLDSSAVIEQAMLLEKYVQLRGMGLQKTDLYTEQRLRSKEPTWIIVAIVRALWSVLRDWKNWQSACRTQRANHPDDQLSSERFMLLTHLIEEVTILLREVLPAGEVEGPLIMGHQWPLRLAIREMAQTVHSIPVPGIVDITGKLRDEPREGLVPVGVIFAPEYFSGSLQDHPECKERIWAVLDRLDTIRAEKRGVRKVDFRYRGAALALIEDLKRETCERAPLHSESYLRAVEETSRLLRKGSISREAIRDLEVRAGSWTAACRSTGALLRGVDLVLDGEHQVVFCPNRPPGHLAGNKICIFDNIGAAVLRALTREPELRIAVFDADAHHGLHIQRSFFSDSRVLYCSLHEAEVHPGQGYVTELGRAPTDKDSDQIDWDLGGVGTTLNVPIRPDPSRAAAFEQYYVTLFRDHILPAVRRFKPDLVFIAGGTDGDERDTFSNLKMTPRCFYIIGSELAKLASRGIVASLEGGYDLHGGLPDGVEHLFRGMADGVSVDASKIYDALPDAPASPVSHRDFHPIDPICAIDVFRTNGSSAPQRERVEQVYLLGSAEKVLTSKVEDQDLRTVDMKRVRFGLGAGMPSRRGRAGQVGELVACGGILANAEPALSMRVLRGAEGCSPFFVGWRHAPNVIMRFCMNQNLSVKEVLRETSKAFDCSVPVLGVVARFEVVPNELKARWLARAPTLDVRGDPAPDNACIRVQNAWFANSSGDALKSFTAVGIILRPGHPAWHSPEVERIFAAATTYVPPEGTPSEKDFFHMHLFADPVTDGGRFWLIDDYEGLLRDLVKAPGGDVNHVAHLDGPTLVSRAVVGIVPLDVDSRLP